LAQCHAEFSSALGILQSEKLFSWAEFILNQFNNNPESINDSVETASSKRFKTEFPSYRKTTHGSDIAKTIGLKLLREKCCHFDNWLTKLESLT